MREGNGEMDGEMDKRDRKGEMDPHQEMGLESGHEDVFH